MPTFGVLVETYRQTELRLRLLLLGDGIDRPPMVKGEEHQRRVQLEFRHLRDAFQALVDAEREIRGTRDAGSVGLDEALREIASLRAHLDDGPEDAPVLMSPAEAAVLLGVSPSTIYRAIRRGDIVGERPSHGHREALRVSASELHKISRTLREKTPDATASD